MEPRYFIIPLCLIQSASHLVAPPTARCHVWLVRMRGDVWGVLSAESGRGCVQEWARLAAWIALDAGLLWMLLFAPYYDGHGKRIHFMW